MFTALLYTVIAVKNHFGKMAPSYAIPCLATFGIFPLVYWCRSFNPILSIGQGILFFVVLGTGYLACRAGLIIPLFRAIYWCYTVSLAAGLSLGNIIPSQFPLWSTDDFTGRTRLSVFRTFPGTMGETAAYLALLEPLLFNRPNWKSRLFLIVINFLAGGKVSTVLLLLLLSAEYLSRIRMARAWQTAIPVATLCVALAFAGVYLSFVRGANAADTLGRHLDTIYGHDVADEAASLDGRVEIWQESVHLIVENPFLGYGFGGAREILTDVAAWSGSAHNAFLELGLAGGVLGLALFFAGLGCVFHACFHAPPNLRGHLLRVLAYMMAIAFTGITFNFPSFFGVLILIFILYRSTESSGIRSSCEFVQPLPNSLQSRIRMSDV
jgi:O-Antigen ligase